MTLFLRVINMCTTDSLTDYYK